jgi:hypothetical protein
MLLLYPGELYRLMGASSLEFEVTCTLEKSLQLSPEDHALAPRHSDEEMRTVTKSSESTKKYISRGITLHTVVAHF